MIITISIPEDEEDLVIAAYCDIKGYREEIEDEIILELIPNPESRLEFIKRMLIGQIKDIVKMNNRRMIEKQVSEENIDANIDVINIDIN